MCCWLSVVMWPVVTTADSLSSRRGLPRLSGKNHFVVVIVVMVLLAATANAIANRQKVQNCKSERGEESAEEEERKRMKRKEDNKAKLDYTCLASTNEPTVTF
ncbi:hypothetical protein X798_06108 [Onchocerca flexuosa]|uniref:Uncharacterized protein n=1 Tax=Onchocerca flexuosa TaxID=387005 RepID=A0A238BNT3_9BILA|nr:hypothetical protein X798_06108 [Onchocerca flexuosa]